LEGKVDMKTFFNMMKDQSGAAAAEYALILAIVGATIAVAAVALGGAVSGSMNRATACINAGSAATASTCG
jgi:pilus assembly protein Flp/PilA